jgi:hypothetical protein
MTKRQEYWMHLRIIHTVTGVWNRRMSFQAAHEWVNAYTYEVTTGYDKSAAMQRAYDYLTYNKRMTLVSKGELAWN